MGRQASEMWMSGNFEDCGRCNNNELYCSEVGIYGALEVTWMYCMWCVQDSKSHL